ncbi:MAG TPA: DUF6518 family protein [Candidatus Limnocylindria bacterium]
MIARLIGSVLLGVALGLFSARGDGVQVMVINGLANAASPWIVAAFTAGALQGSIRLAAVAGALALLVAVITYYVGFLAGGATFLVPFLVVWAIAALLAGGLFGLAGGAWRTDRARWGAAAVSLVSGLLLAEAGHRLILLQVWTGIEWDRTYMQVAVADIAGAGLVMLLLRGRLRWHLVAILVPVVAVAGLALLSVGDRILGLAAAAAQ